MHGCLMRVQVDMDLMAGGRQPVLWSAEEPNLYILVLTLVNSQGQHLDTESTQARHCCGEPFKRESISWASCILLPCMQQAVRDALTSCFACMLWHV